VRAALLPACARGVARRGGRLRVLVTGGSGFIGSHVLDALRARGHEAVVFDLVPSRHHEPGTYETVIGDLTSREETRRAVRGCHAVIHLAAVADVNEVVANPVLADRVNVHGTQMILEAARHEGVERVLYGSTIWVYSDSPAADPDEDSALAQPRHLYTATKLAGENYVASYNAQFGGRHTILRFGIPYGPRARPAAVVPSFIARAQRGEALSIAGDGRQTRQFVYVVDLAHGIVNALAPEAAGRIYNLVGDEETSVREIADAVRELVAPVPIVHGPERPADVRLGRVSGARAAGELRWSAETTFGDGLRLYLDWLTDTSCSPVAEAAASTAGSATAVLRHESPEL
jgi:UDP-glucose 4-epimerase